jgi:Sulfotransferase domain
VKAQGSGLARPRLVRCDAKTVLVEHARYRRVPDDVGAVLQRTLGAPEDVNDDEFECVTGGLHAQVLDIEVAVRRDVRTLVTWTPAGSLTAVAGSVEARTPVDRALHLRVGEQERPVGAGILDRLTVSRADGVTHVVVPASDHSWLQQWPRVADHLARRATVVATSDAGTLWHLAPPPAVGAPKVFGIGLNKTGTTSLHLALETLGLRSFHWGGEQAFDSVLRAQRDGERLLYYVGEQYDAYADIEPLTVRFDVADVQYPGSRFVLTVRDVDSWIDSRRRHVERNRRRELADTYHGGNTRIDEDLWRSQWRTHMDRVQTYFGDRDDLLTLNILDGDGWDRLAPFLGRSVPDVAFPHGNADLRSGSGIGPRHATLRRRAVLQRLRRRFRTAWRRAYPSQR